MTALVLMLLAIDRWERPVSTPAPTVVVIDGGVTATLTGAIALDGGQTTVLQGTSPWVVGGHSIQGNVTVDGGVIAVNNWPSATQVIQNLSRDGGFDWPVTAKLTDSLGVAFGTASNSIRITPTDLNVTIDGGYVAARLVDSTGAAYSSSNGLYVNNTAGNNPCQNPSATLAAVSGATSGTSATQIIALSGTTKVYLCTVNVTGVSGTSPTFSLVYGTGSNCATGQNTFLGAWTTAANTVYSFNRPFVTPAGQAVCYKDSGTNPVQNYAITYVQQ